MPCTGWRSRSLVGAFAALVVFVTVAPGTPAAAPPPFGAQQAGHGTLPTTGATAPGSITTVEREEDQVIASIEELRRVLADTARQYKKMKDVDRVEKQRDLLAALARVRTEVTAARELVATR